MMLPIRIVLRILAAIGRGLLNALMSLLLMCAEVLNILADEILRPLSAQMQKFAVDLEEKAVEVSR